MTTHKTQVLAVPPEVFAVDFRIVDGDVLRFPECILRVDYSIVNLDIACVLEAVIAVLTIIGDADVVTMHERVVAIGDPHVTECDAVAVPEKLFAVGKVSVLNLDAAHTAEELGRQAGAVFHYAVARVPQARACALGEVAIIYFEICVLPEYIFTFEAAINGNDIASLFYARLAGVDCHVFQPQSMSGI